ncbi:hypothetical protein [uncultured Deinococcus sp.]|uniref:hypothetical protein n=1 Tax=uncultured Deinococcus sp. TaxID=158789 RepID=UPI0025E54A9B|nr:hypothetical protein [uncultured Deinococcus sp.]
MNHLRLICTALVLSACGSASPAPTPPGGTPGSTQSSPYNPNRNPTEDTDSRVPYYGEWAWAITFPDGSSAVGRLSISKRITPKAGYANAGAGAAVYCPDGDDCPYESDTGLIGTTSNNGHGELIVELDDPASTGFLRFTGVDLDGVVGTEGQGRPTLTGNGYWNYGGGRGDYVGFTLSQLSTTPPVR